MIELGNPAGLAALLALPAILLLHFVRPRRRSVSVSTVSLWREALRERQRGAGLRRLLGDLSLLLLLLLAAVLAVSLADPRWIAETDLGEDAVVVVDVSASMQARAGIGTTRFELARREGLDLVAGMADDGRMLVMTSGRRGTLRSGFEGSREALRAVLAGLQPTDEAGDPRAALSLALSLLRNRSSARVYFVTDGAFDESADLGSPRIEPVLVGGAAENVAITRFDVRRELGSEERYQVLLAARNYGREPREVPVRIRVGDAPAIERRLELPGGGRNTLIVPLEGATSGRAEASLIHDDDLAADNRAFAVLGSEQVLRVLLFSAGNFYLESVLGALPNVEVSKRDLFRADHFAAQARVHDVVVFDRIPPPALDRGRYLLVDAVAPGLPFTARDVVDRPRISGVGPSPLVADLDLTGVRIARARKVVVADPPPGLSRLFWSEETDLALAYLDGDLRVVYLGFDIAQSSLPLHAAFPLLLAESLAWLHPRGSRFAPTQLRAGDRVVIEVPGSRDELAMTTPGGDQISVPVTAGRAHLDAFSRAGFYRYSGAGGSRELAVNLTDEGESDLRRRAPAAAVPSRPEPAAAARASIVLWPYLAGFAAMVLALEWLAWGGGGRRA